MSNKAILQKIVTLIRTIDQLHDLGDAIYDVREREGKGWEGPNVTEYGKSVSELREILKSIGEVK